MIPFNTQLCLLAKCHSPQHKLLREACVQWVQRAEQCLYVWFDGGAGWCGTGCISVRGFKLTTRLTPRLRATAFMTAKGSSGAGDICMLESTGSFTEGRLGFDQHQWGSWIRIESLLVFVSVAGSLSALVLFHLHGHDNNRCAGLKEIRLGDPQFKINKKTTHYMGELATVAS